MSGVTSEGFVLPTFEEIDAELETEILAETDPELDLSATEPLGQLKAAAARQIAKLWELGETAFTANDPDRCEFFLLDSVCAITGTKRRPATYSRATINCTLSNGVTLAPGAETMIAHEDDESIKFVLDEEEYPSGFTAGSTGTHALIFRADRPGAVLAQATKLTEILTPVSGWSAATNPADALPGRAEETDEELRTRREQALAAAGNGTYDAMRSDLLNVEGVESAFVFVNRKDFTENGLPPHSFMAVVFDGFSPAADDDEIAQAVFNNAPPGGNWQGTESAVIEDANGDEQEVFFERANVLTIYVAITLEVTDEYPVDGDAQVKAAIVAAGNARGLGADVIRNRIEAAALTIKGVEDVTACTLGLAPSPVGTSNIAVERTEIAYFTASNIAVTS